LPVGVAHNGSQVVQIHNVDAIEGQPCVQQTRGPHPPSRKVRPKAPARRPRHRLEGIARQPDGPFQEIEATPRQAAGQKIIQPGDLSAYPPGDTGTSRTPPPSVAARLAEKAPNNRETVNQRANCAAVGGGGQKIMDRALAGVVPDGRLEIVNVQYFASDAAQANCRRMRQQSINGSSSSHCRRCDHSNFRFISSFLSPLAACALYARGCR
jgi:hypothetical protein